MSAKPIIPTPRPSAQPHDNQSRTFTKPFNTESGDDSLTQQSELDYLRLEAIPQSERVTGALRRRFAQLAVEASASDDTGVGS